RWHAGRPHRSRPLEATGIGFLSTIEAGPLGPIHRLRPKWIPLSATRLRHEKTGMLLGPRRGGISKMKQRKTPFLMCRGTSTENMTVAQFVRRYLPHNNSCYAGYNPIIGPPGWPPNKLKVAGITLIMAGKNNMVLFESEEKDYAHLNYGRSVK